MLGQVRPILGLCWAHVGPMLAYVGSMLAPCWPMLALSWPMLALSCPYVGPTLAYVGPMLAQWRMEKPQRRTEKMPNMSSETLPKELEMGLPARLQKRHRKGDTAAQNKAPRQENTMPVKALTCRLNPIEKSFFSAAAAYRQTAALRPPYRTPGHTKTAHNFVPKSRPNHEKWLYVSSESLETLNAQKRINVLSESLETLKGCCCCCCCCCCCTNRNL